MSTMKEVRGTLADSSLYVARRYRETERDRDKQTDRQTETDRQTDWQRDRETETETQRDREKLDGFENMRPVLDLVLSVTRVSMRVYSDCMILPRTWCCCLQNVPGHRPSADHPRGGFSLLRLRLLLLLRHGRVEPHARRLTPGRWNHLTSFFFH